MTTRPLVPFVTFLLVLAAGTASPVFAQDPVKVAPNVYTLVFENERVRVSDLLFEPGEKIVPHSHPDHFVYVLSEGTLKISKPDGTSMDFTGKPGQVVWIPAETHWAENTGKTDFHAIVVELKEAAPKAPAPEAAAPK